MVFKAPHPTQILLFFPWQKFIFLSTFWNLLIVNVFFMKNIIQKVEERQFTWVCRFTTFQGKFLWVQLICKFDKYRIIIIATYKRVFIGCEILNLQIKSSLVTNWLASFCTTSILDVMIFYLGSQSSRMDS